MIYQGNTDVKPEDVGFDPATIDNLDNFFLDLVEQEKLQCASYLLAKRGKIISHKSMGKLSGLEDKGDLKPDSIRTIASITKMFTATAIMQLVEKGKLYLAQPVSTILKEFDTDLHRGITIFHILTHTSGLVADPGSYKEPYPREWFSERSNKDNWIKLQLEGPLENEPGKVWSYCTKGFMFLGEIIFRVSGIPYTNYIIENILKPLGMDESFFKVPKELHDRVCLVTEWDKIMLQKGMPPFSKSLVAGGGLFSTLGDLFKFGQMLLNIGVYNGKRLLSRKSVETMTRNHLNNVPQYCWGAKGALRSYGLGFRIMQFGIETPGSYGHGGSGRSFIVLDPTEDLLFVYYIPTSTQWVAESEINSRQIVWSGIL